MEMCEIKYMFGESPNLVQARMVKTGPRKVIKKKTGFWAFYLFSLKSSYKEFLRFLQFVSAIQQTCYSINRLAWHGLREDTHKKVVFLVVGPLRV